MLRITLKKDFSVPLCFLSCVLHCVLSVCSLCSLCVHCFLCVFYVLHCGLHCVIPCVLLVCSCLHSPLETGIGKDLLIGFL